MKASFTKTFPAGPTIAVENLELQNGVTVLFGASGSGKTTILRCLTGLEKPDSGEIHSATETWFKASTRQNVPPEKRQIGFVPQDYALFPHLNVAENVGYGIRGASSGEKSRRVMDTLEWLGIRALAGRLPRQLSGGESQRVALARAVARKPDLLLLDEPLSALDAPTRLRLRSELRQQLVQLGLPTILVTHDRTEAMALGDRMIVLAEGKIQQAGTMTEVFSRPASLPVAQIAGTETILQGQVIHVEGAVITVSVGDTKLVAFAPDFPHEAKTALVCIRAEDVMLVAGALPPASARNRLAGVVIAAEEIGPLVQVEIDCGFRLKANLTPQSAAELAIRPRSAIGALIKAPHVHLIPNG